MQFWPKDQDPRLDERSARFHARVMKSDLATLDYVFDQGNRDINVARASTYVTWDYDQDMWCEVDHLMMNFYIKAKTTDTREYLEDKINRDVVKLIKGPCYYKSAKVYCTIDMDHPEDESIYDIVKRPKAERNAYCIEGDEGDITYHVTLHIQECNPMDLIVYDEADRGNYFDLSGKNLETKEKEIA